MMDFNIIDAHSHLWLRQDTEVNGLPIRTLTNGRSLFMGEERQMVPPFMIDGRNSAEVFLSNMNYAQVSAAVVTQEFIDGIQNEYLAKVSHKYPDRFFVCGMCEFRKPGYLQQAKELISSGFKAIKIPAHRLFLKEGRVMLNSDEMMEMFHYMQEKDIILSIDLADGDTQVQEMKEIIQELKNFLKPKDIGTDSDRALLLDFQATLETKPEKAIKLEEDALAQIENITADNARLVSNLHANLGGLYRMNGHPDLAREHMEKSISLLDQFNLLHINDSIPQIANYAMFLTEQQEPERGISELQKLSGIIKEYHSDDCLDYAKVQETLGTIYLMTANLPQAKTHFKRAFKIYEKIWADEPEMIEAKYQEIQELYPQIGFSIGKTLSGLLTK